MGSRRETGCCCELFAASSQEANYRCGESSAFFVIPSNSVEWRAGLAQNKAQEEGTPVAAQLDILQAEGEPEEEVQKADIDEPSLGEAVGEGAAGFAGGITGAAKQAVLVAVEEDAEWDDDNQTDDADDFQAKESFG